jgi:2-polyprenyl-3-methyl-5-hydroxy-6-metoxy-1,4-benzoquinol methylase
MKQAIIRYLLRFSYPQNVFADAIINCIDINSKNEMIDAPCGDGITSWQFSRVNSLTVYGYDINPTSVQNAKNNFKRKNLFFEDADINAVISKHSHAKYFCIINSLFLLPKPDAILKALYDESKDDRELFVVVPNINGRNFKWFEKHNPGVNNLILGERDFADYFAKQGWRLKNVTPLAYVHSYGRKDSAMFSVFAPLYLRILNYIQTRLENKTPNYFLLQLTKA